MEFLHVTTLLGFIDFGAYKDIIVIAGMLIGAFVLLKSGVLQELTGGYKKQADLYKSERDQALQKVKDLTEYNRILILDSQTRMEIMQQERDKSHGK